MKSLNKWLNIAIFFSVLFSAICLKDEIRFSSDILAFLPEGKNKTIAHSYQNLNHKKEVFVATKGLNTEAFSKIKEVEKSILKTGFFEQKNNLSKPTKLLEYVEKYRYYTEDFKYKDVDIAKALNELLQKSAISPFYSPIDNKDPFGFFASKELALPLSFYRGHLALGEAGYLSIFQIKEDIDEIKVYDFLIKLEKDEDSLHLFSSVFYFVENAQNIKKDVNWLLAISTLLLFFIYLFVFKNISLLINTVLTLVTSVLVALGIVFLLWQEVSIFVLAFGAAVSSIGIDYMLHHYFHHHYAIKKPLNKSVFWGFLTTAILFALFVSVDFLLLKQLSLFAFIVLLIAYLHFAFLYPHIGFKAPPKLILFKWKFYSLNYRYVTIGSLLILSVAWSWLHLDTDVRHLDYQNEKRLKTEAFFKSKLPFGEYSPFMLEASSIDTLIKDSRQIKDEFPKVWLPLSKLVDKNRHQERKNELTKLVGLNESIYKLAKDMGFKESFFKETYSSSLLELPYIDFSIKTLHEMDFDVVNEKNSVLVQGYVPKEYKKAFQGKDGVYIMEADTLFLDAISELFKEIIWLGALGITLLVSMLWFACKRRFLLAFTYIVFPMAFIVSIFSIFSFSVMHLFMMFIVLALSVDYGIYIARNDGEALHTQNAILFSLLSTFAGFGVLSLSDVGALRDLGVIACLGIVAIGILLAGRKMNEFNCDR